MTFTFVERIFAGYFLLISVTLLAASAPSAFGQQRGEPVHGLWVWKSAQILEGEHSSENLRDFCKSQGINEVYVSVSAQSEASEDTRLAHLIGLLHRANIRVEALLSSADADEPGKHREKLLEHVRGIVQFNQRHPAERFDGIHLDVEPQQRPENKGPGNLKFLPGLVDAFREVRSVAEASHLSVNADIQNKLLKGDLSERRMLLTSLPRLTLMLYELSSPGDGESAEQMAEKVRTASGKFLSMAYQGIDDRNLAKLVMGLRTPDYGELLPAMLQALDDANRTDPHYLGWARHSYNDYLKAGR
ncbi:MAG TPA: hypothetical protein VN875_09880 [Candidatus Binatus sp.]|jgi:hypothetical protein|nr:hypothetical protein [Candidatus Binatus sp.]